MNKIKVILFVIISSCLILGNVSISQEKTKFRKPNSQFSRLEQPLPLKLLVTLGGGGLIVTEVWWFLFSKTKSKKTKS
ncbi:hypothetical protein [Cyanobacterium sp. uoEpiScrs1]|uniref:hypothetical protein n=1 Tax=Cyanobacterium sp. uoEpiScrs1 TaxID=2976343 RepID=UPI00226A9CE3|nr:hypothetical protein [Cyanobacterium sp. uoEpiScrs1]